MTTEHSSKNIGPIIDNDFLKDNLNLASDLLPVHEDPFISLDLLTEKKFFSFCQ